MAVKIAWMHFKTYSFCFIFSFSFALPFLKERFHACKVSALQIYVVSTT